MADLNGNLKALSLNEEDGTNTLVTLEDYNLKSELLPGQKFIKLSPLDMNMPRFYGSRWVLCFPLSDKSDKRDVFETLREGLAHTIFSIPWISGSIGLEEGSDPKDNRIQVVEGLAGAKLLYKDLTKELPTYAELKKSNFPLATLTSALISPLQIFDPAQPVFAAQANFIDGGLLLTIGTHHSACDATGLDAILETWALNTTAVHGSKSFSGYDPISNDRTPLFEGLPAHNIADYPEYMLMPTPTTDSSHLAPHSFQMPPMTSKIFYFSPQTLDDVKAAARAYSTNDALNAFFWHHMTIARNPVPDDTENVKTSNLLFAVNIRGRTSPPLPHNYLGNASFGGITQRLAISKIKDAETGLIDAAAAVRSSLNAVNKPVRVPMTIGLLSSRPNAQDFKFACHGFLGPDLTTTSWADLGIRHREWGVLGKPEGFRMPYEGADGTIAVLPRLGDGGLEVMAALESTAMQRMVGSAEFAKYAKEWA